MTILSIISTLYLLILYITSLRYNSHLKANENLPEASDIRHLEMRGSLTPFHHK